MMDANIKMENSNTNKNNNDISNNTTDVDNNNNNNNNGSVSNAILCRLKEQDNSIEVLQLEIQKREEALEKLKSDNERLKGENKELNADKRKDMEEYVENGIQNWLNSLTGISEEVKKQFKSGISRLAQEANNKDAAWEVVCNASMQHNENVQKIQKLIDNCNEKEETIASLLKNNKHDPNFTLDSSRIAGFKRQRTEPEIPNGGTKNPREECESYECKNDGGNHMDAWASFSSMLKQDSRSQYY